MNPTTVTVAPLVLLSVVDHYNRVKTGAKRRVVGVILGERSNGVVSVTNSFAVPFEEDNNNPDVWYLDRHYIEQMLAMFRKINAREKLIGWYHSGPRLRAADLKITETLQHFTSQPLLLVVDVDPNHVGIPTDAYIAHEEVKPDGTSAGKTFQHLPCSIKAEEAEEIGVEHLLRDVHDAAAGTLATRIAQQLASLQALSTKLQGVAKYLERVETGALPLNHSILSELQNVLNLLPNIAAQNNIALKSAFTTHTNDQMMVLYLSSVVRAVISFHDMIDNKLHNKRALERGEEH